MSSRPKDRREEILRTAADLFRRQGYSTTTMAQIADEIGILKGSLYHHYRSKEEILFAMTRDPLKDLADRVAIIQRSRKPAVEKVRDAVREHVRAFADSHPHLAVITAERTESLPVGIRDEIVALRRQYQHSWERIIEDGKRRGVIVADYPSTVLVNVLLGSLNWMHRWYEPAGALDPSEMASLISDVFLNGVMARAPVEDYEGAPGSQLASGG